MPEFNHIPLTRLQTAECEKMAVRYLRRLRRLRARLVALRVPVTHPMWVVLTGAWDAASRRLAPAMGLEGKVDGCEVGGWSGPPRSRHRPSIQGAETTCPTHDEASREEFAVLGAAMVAAQ